MFPVSNCTFVSGSAARQALLVLLLSVALFQPARASAQTEGDLAADAIGLIRAPDEDAAVAVAPGAPTSSDIVPEEAFTSEISGPDGMFSLVAPPPVPRTPDRLTTAIAVPVVVELFTAQGCSTCPAADGLIATLADQPDVLPLSWHVDYWDYLGWTDGFADPLYARRQQGYAAAAGERGIYTPQIIVNGSDTLIGVGRQGLLALIDQHASRPPSVIVATGDTPAGHVIDLTPRASLPGGVQVSLIRYLPRREVAVTTGENSGRTLVYRNIVVGVEKLADWPARDQLRLTVRNAAGSPGDYPSDTRHALIVQQPTRGGRPGPILAAVRLD